VIKRVKWFNFPSIGGNGYCTSGLGIWFEKIRLNVPTKISFAVLNAQIATVSMPADPFKRWVKTNKFMKQYPV
jgi:hypothetical protein